MDLEREKPALKSAAAPRCVLCGSAIHSTKDCPEVVCRICKQKGHGAFRCPGRKRGKRRKIKVETGVEGAAALCDQDLRENFEQETGGGKTGLKLEEDPARSCARRVLSDKNSFGDIPREEIGGPSGEKEENGFGGLSYYCSDTIAADGRQVTQDRQGPKHYCVKVLHYIAHYIPENVIPIPMHYFQEIVVAIHYHSSSNTA